MAQYFHWVIQRKLIFALRQRLADLLLHKSLIAMTSVLFHREITLDGFAIAWAVKWAQSWIKMAISWVNIRALTHTQSVSAKG